MKPIESVGHWFMKTGMFFAGVVVAYTSINYFVGGGKLIVGESIPIGGLISCLLIPLGISVGFGGLYIIAHTEKEMDE